LFLQIDIWENSRGPRRADWEVLKAEGQRIAERLQESERFQRDAASTEPTQFDLHELIQEVARSWAARQIDVRIAPPVASEPLLLTGCSMEIGHLLHLVLEQMFFERDGSMTTDRDVAIQTEKTIKAVKIRIARDAGAEPAYMAQPGEAANSLVQAACQSIALRIDATIRQERHANGSSALVVELPQTSSRNE
jgi:hypothetical protein